MSVSIKLLQVKPTWEFWNEYNLKYQVYDTKEFDWFEDNSNNKRFVRNNNFIYLNDDFYWKCKPKNYKEIKKYINDNFDWEYKEMHLRAIDEIRNNKEGYDEFWW